MAENLFEAQYDITKKSKLKKFYELNKILIFSSILILIIVQTKLWTATVSGYVRDSETGKSIPNANILISDFGHGTVSNPYGHFQLNISSGTYILETSVIGFKTDFQEIFYKN